jgi:hypothetical protein
LERILIPLSLKDDQHQGQAGEEKRNNFLILARIYFRFKGGFETVEA